MQRNKMTKNFKRHEFACKCGCGFDDISPKLVAKLQLARDLFGEPIKVNSGCRCLSHNRKEKSRDTSSHIKGLAVDVSCNNTDTFKLIKLAYCLGRAGFKRIGINTKKKFIHIDIDKEKAQNVIFTY